MSWRSNRGPLDDACLLAEPRRSRSALNNSGEEPSSIGRLLPSDKAMRMKETSIIKQLDLIDEIVIEI